METPYLTVEASRTFGVNRYAVTLGNFFIPIGSFFEFQPAYSTVTLLARFLGLSTSVPQTRAA